MGRVLNYLNNHLLRLGRTLHASSVAERIENRLEKTSPRFYSHIKRVWLRNSNQTIYNVFGDSFPGRPRALLSYLPDAFSLNLDSSSFFVHPNKLFCVELGRVIRDLGFIVDVVFCLSTNFVPRYRYALFIESGTNLERVRHLIPDDCIKILLGTGNHWLFQNRAELDRLEAIRRKKGVVLSPRRLSPPTFIDLTADAIILVGNDFTRETFSHVRCPIFSRDGLFSQKSVFYNRLWSTARHEFLWHGGFGAVLKGLDLVLESFSGMPELQLHVVGGIENEQDFFIAFRKELLETRNISYHGYINYTTNAFTEIANKCSSVVYPSASDASPGAVLACMSAGLIPIVSRQTGIDVEDFGIMLQECSVKSIQSAVRKISTLGEQELQMRSTEAGNWVQKNCNSSVFVSEMRQTLESILKR